MDDEQRPGVLLRAVGDAALIGTAARVLESDSDPEWAATASYLSEADIAFANLEMPIPLTVTEPDKPGVSPDFRGSPESLRRFLLAGIDVVAIATNHMMDWGATGLTETIDQLRERGVAVVGGGRNLDEALDGEVLDRKGVRVGFVAFTPPQRWSAGKDTPGTAPLRLENVRESLRRIREADVKVVSLHWGIEMSNYPMPQDRKLAAQIVEEGADLILGHHPHVVQGVEALGASHVAYSMGNFIFDIYAGRVQHGFDPWDLRAGCLVEAVLDKDGVSSFDVVPTFLSEQGIGALARGAEKERIARLLSDLSTGIETGSREVWDRAGERLVAHKLKVLRKLAGDAGPGFLLEEIAHIRPRHVRLLLGFIASKLRRGTR